MFKKLKDKIEEEFKQAPLKFPVSVQQLAQVISPSQSVNSLSDNNASTSLTYPTDMSNVSTDFFSIGGDDDPQGGGSKTPMTLHSVDLTATSPSNMTHGMNRSRRSSLSSVTSEASSLFPVFESGLNQSFLQSDLESEMEDGMSGQIEKISKEQLYQSFKKILNRYNKYKNKYTELMKHYKELQHDNFKTKNVLQESQDKALRRMAELREQCQLEQKAKAHLEEALRNDVEERDHIINTLKTKISLLSNGTENEELIDLGTDGRETKSENSSQSKELWHLKSQNEDLQREVERLKKIKENACNFIHRCDTTINEASEDVRSDNIKQKMSELKSEIQKMKVENESLSHLLSRNLVPEEERKCQASGDNNLMADLSGLESSQGDQKAEEKDKKIEKLNNLLLKCKEKISTLNAEIKAKNMIIEDSNKKLKELRDEVGAYKTREEENALSVAENKKAIHEELNAKEEQIKALTKELKTKENEFIKDKAEMVKSYEDRIRNMTSDFAKELKLKSDQNQKLQDDLKAKEIVSISLDKVKSIEQSFASLLEFVRTRSSAFEEFANGKTTEIERAQQRLEEKLSTARRNLTELLQNSQKAKSVEQMEAVGQEKALELQSEIKGPTGESPENFHIVEKLKTDVINLSKKLEILESELEGCRKELKSEREEKDKWREKQELVEAEGEKMKKDFQEKLDENAELRKALTDRNEKIKKVENEKKLLQKATSEKVETESKLREYIENYNKLEKENRTLQNDLVEKCGKLLKELNESKEKIRALENQEKTKADELEMIRNQYLNSETKRSEEKERLARKVETLQAELSSSREELEKMQKESEAMRAVLPESEETKMELEKMREICKERESELEKREERTKELEKDLQAVRKELSQEKRSTETTRNELEALRNNLKLELKEKDEKSILVDKLTQECNLLLAEIENLKKSHGNMEKKLESELESARKEIGEKNNLVESLRQELKQSLEEKETKTSGVDELTKKCETLAAEIEFLNKQQSAQKAAILQRDATNQEMKTKLAESESVLKTLNDKVSELTSEKNAMFGELLVRLSEAETLRNGLMSAREELEEKVKAFEEEKARLMSESENKLNILKKEIEFINTKHEEDIGNFEENLNHEMKEANEKMEIANKTSAELLEKLERITNERNELKAMEEEKNLKISELENCLSALKVELDEKFNGERKAEEDGGKRGEETPQEIMNQRRETAEKDEEIESLKLKLKSLEESISRDDEVDDIKEQHREELKRIILQYDSEISERDEEIESLKSKLAGYDDALDRLKVAKEELKVLKRELAEKEDARPKEDNPEDEDEIQEQHREELKRIILEYDRVIGERDDEIENLKSKLSGYDDALEHLKIAKEELKILRRELAEKDNVIEAKAEENARLKETDAANVSPEDVEALRKNLREMERNLEEQKKETENALEREKRKWEEKMAEFIQKHEEQTKSQKQTVYTENSLAEPESLEEVDLKYTSKVAVDGLESGSSSSELLQKQLIQQAAEMKELKRQHKREIMELKKLTTSRRRGRRNSSENQDWLTGGGLENDTEHEYLRNILYEYMMGKEQLVLAKVLSAIVRFNEEQTHNVLEKEQQRQTLFGQLGLL